MSTTTKMAWTLAALLAVACGSSEDSSGSGAAGTETATPPGTEAPAADATSPPGTASPPVAPPCAGKEALKGDLDWTLKVGGMDRELHVHVPKAYDPNKPTPMVLNFHGYTSNGAQQDALSHMSEKADEAGFIAVHPEGTGASPSWNAGACCGVAATSAVDDIGFVSAILAEATAKLCVDPHRVYATGMSNGGFFSHRLACEMSDRIAAIAPVAGVLGMPTCAPARPVPVLQFHGKLDGVVAYAGNAGLGFPSVAQTVAQWASRNGCSATPRETSKKGEVTCVTHDNCKDGAEVSLCSVAGGGHTWPGGTPVPSLGHTTTEIVATDMMWDFFVKHPLP